MNKHIRSLSQALLSRDGCERCGRGGGCLAGHLPQRLPRRGGQLSPGGSRGAFGKGWLTDLLLCFFVSPPRAANTVGAVQCAMANVEASRDVQGRESVEVERGQGQNQSRKQRPNGWLTD